MPSLPNPVRLDPVTAAMVRQVAKMRYTYDRKHHVTDAKMGAQPNAVVDLDGFGAEVAFGIYANLCPDYTAHPRSTYVPEGRYDFVLPDGRTVDVKQTAYPNGHLLATLKKSERPAHIYVLVIGTLPLYHIVGWATKRELFQPNNIRNLGHGNGYALPQNQLHDMSKLWQVPMAISK